MILHGKRQALRHSVKDVSCGKVVYRKLQLSNRVRIAKVSCQVLTEMERTGEADEPPSDAELEMEDPGVVDNTSGVFGEVDSSKKELELLYPNLVRHGIDTTNKELIRTLRTELLQLWWREGGGSQQRAQSSKDDSTPRGDI